MVASFDIYDNCHPLSKDLMKDIAAYTSKSLDVNKPIRLLGLRFSRVMQKTEWMNRTADTINLPTYHSSVEDLLKYSESSNLCFYTGMAMDIDAINSETTNIHYTAHQFWEQGVNSMPSRFFFNKN